MLQCLMETGAPWISYGGRLCSLLGMVVRNLLSGRECQCKPTSVNCVASGGAWSFVAAVSSGIELVVYKVD